MKKEKFTFFWQNASPFSQWHRSKFRIDSIDFTHAEQWMMYSKAMLFKDVVRAGLILRSNNPKEQKAIGREVYGFDPKVWDEEKFRIVKQGNRAKFTQNPELLKALLATAGTTLVEASPYDKVWGIGLLETDPKAQDRATWQGENLLGEALTELRDDLLLEGFK